MVWAGRVDGAETRQTDILAAVVLTLFDCLTCVTV